MRRTRHRRRFHTDRIVANRRARYLRETPSWSLDERWLYPKLSYGRLASTDPWDCGNADCGVCRYWDHGRRAQEKRQWKKECQI